ncbi:tolloid-like protein 2 [Diadema antillarum]|uniref:tolloid-like protein 2 n=1 Tax=Diadema antillarum TaxID=105358 RepID=UPI003A836D66
MPNMLSARNILILVVCLSGQLSAGTNVSDVMPTERVVTTGVSGGQAFSLESGQNVTISSPNYPLNYDSNADITWMVSVPEGCGITLRFVTFNTERSYDKLTIADNPDFSEVADEFSGQLVSSSHEYDFSSAWIRFHSDSSITSDGFEAIISARCTEESGIMCSQCREMRSNMPGFSGDSGVGPCEDFPSVQPVNCSQSGSCKFTNITSYMYHPLFGNVSMTQLERGCSDEGMPPNVCLTPADLPGVMEGLRGSLEASGMSFRGLEGQLCTCNTGDLCNEGPMGVVATSTATNTVNTKDVPVVQTLNLESEESATISSPNYPQQYDSNTDITWMVSVPDGCGIGLYFVSFSTERSYDKLTIADNPAFSDVADEFSGRLDIATSTEYDFSSAWIRFHSDSSVTSDGFEAVISARCIDEHTFNLESGQRASIIFPSPPVRYYTDTEVTWMVSVPEGCDMTLHFVRFRIWTRYDTLQIADNPYFSGAADEFSGVNVPSTRNDYHFSPVWISFHSDYLTSSVKFAAIISATCPDVEPDPTSVCPSGWFPAGSKCLHIKDQMWWFDAVRSCNTMAEVELTNGEMRQPSLLFLESDAEFDALQLHFDGLSAWINCHKLGEPEWVCETDARGTRSNYRNWDAGEPDDEYASCACIYMLNRKFHNEMCGDKRTAICQIVVEETNVPDLISNNGIGKNNFHNDTLQNLHSSPTTSCKGDALLAMAIRELHFLLGASSSEAHLMKAIPHGLKTDIMSSSAM